MPNDPRSSDRTAAQGAVVASLVFVLSTASPQPVAAVEEVDRIQVPSIDPAAATASARLSSELEYPEVTGPQTLSAATAGSVTPSLGSPVDPWELLRAQVRSFLLETVDRLGVTPPSSDAVNAALRFVDLLPVDSQTPHVSVADDGEINFFRRSHGVYVDVGFFGDGQIHYYARVEDQGIDVDGSEFFTGRSLPRDLVIPITTA